MLTTAQVTECLLSDRLALTACITCVTRNYHLAEDVFQEVCIKAINQSEPFETKTHLLNWFRVSARNRAIDIIRAQQGQFVGLSEEAMLVLERDWSTTQFTEVDARSDALAECIQSLTPRSQQIVKMRYFENRSGQDVAKLLGAKITSTYQAIARIHKTLGDCVQRAMEVKKT